MAKILTSITWLYILVLPIWVRAQYNGAADTVQPKLLDSVTVRSYLIRVNPHAAPDVDNVYINSGKKTITFQPDADRANLSANVARTAFAQIPGLNIWDMDGAGTQINIGSRGTDTHRSIEMNMRQNGYNTNSDVFGYPEDHYTPPMQAIDDIQFVRGSAALQYGSQFGGMMNYTLKKGDSSKTIGVESEQTAGSNGFFNSFNAAGGSKGKWSYYAFYDSRHGDGWRPNARFNYQSYYGSVNYQFSSKGNLRLEFSRMHYVQQIAGGLTDRQFKENNKQSLRARNFFSPVINIPAAIFQFDFSPGTRLEVTSNMIIGQRNSVQFINTSNIKDTINPVLGTYNPRQVDRDYYTGFATEARLLHRYKIGSMSPTLAGGIRYSTQLTKRKQKGKGTTGGDYGLSLTGPYGIDLRMHTGNYAFFAENIFPLTKRFSVTPGMRYEIIRSSLDGVISNASVAVHYTGNRNFPLFGTGLQYQATSSTEIYGNISQAYRPYLYASITPADQVGVIDPDLKDSRGFDIDLGYRGDAGDLLHFDVNGFYVFYGNRAGQLTLRNPDSSTFLYTTNVGDCVAAGFEGYASISIIKLLGTTVHAYGMRLFNSLSYTHARYLNGQVSENGKNVSIEGNRAEGTPEWIERAGLQFFFRSFNANLQYSYSSFSYSDANNTRVNPTGATGIVPGYHVFDGSLSWHILKNYHLSGGVNNIANASYFTRRINMYPGPGILPADGRTYYISFGIKM